MTLDELQAQSLKLGIALGEAELHLFDRYMQALIEANRKFNLTRIEDEGEIVRKHFLDSLVPAQQLLTCKSLIDVGAGAGFPGLALAIALPKLHVTLVDSSEKKVRFLTEVIEDLGLGSRVAAVAQRAEELGQQVRYRESFDASISRAVARLNILLEYCLPLTKVGGRFLAMKGPAVREELEHAKDGIQLLGGELAEVIESQLPGGGESRVLVVINKMRRTPEKYPRKGGVMSKKPL